MESNRNIYVRKAKGGHCVFTDNGFLSGPYSTNAEAWRAADRYCNEPTSRAQQTSDWLWSQDTGGLHG